MKTKTSQSLLRSLLPASALLLSLPLVTVLHGQSVEGAVAEAKGDALKAMLKDIDNQLDALDKLEENAPTREERAAAKQRIKALKERRSELRKNFVQARYDSLKADIKAEYDKLSAWTKKTFSSSPEARLDRQLNDARETDEAARKARAEAAAAANPAAVNVNADIAAYRNNPTDVTKAEVKASLAHLDTEIERLEARVDKLPKGADRDAAKRRVKALKDRRGELNSDFRKAWFDSLLADVKAEWQKLVD
ncbi:MAG: hypothetical protein JNK23_06350 [Opitutaceae bacterium]|nr:hypothetical protein [Opitutaceae bacterium]